MEGNNVWFTDILLKSAYNLLQNIPAVVLRGFYR